MCRPGRASTSTCCAAAVDGDGRRGVRHAWATASPPPSTSAEARRATPPSPPSASCRRSGSAVRMGIHTGEVERVGDDFRGRPVNRAARIMAVGHGGQILLSDVTAALAAQRAARRRRAGRPRHPPPPRPRRAGAAVAGACTPTWPARSRRCAAVDASATDLPAPRSSLVGRDARRPARRRPAAPRADRHADRRRRRRQDPAGAAGGRRSADRVAGVGSSRWPASPTPTTSSTPSPSPSGPSAVTPDPLAAATAAAGRRAPALLVLDNCEHVIDAAAAVVDELGDRAAPSCGSWRPAARRSASTASTSSPCARCDRRRAAVELFRAAGGGRRGRRSATGTGRRSSALCPGSTGSRWPSSWRRRAPRRSAWRRSSTASTTSSLLRSGRRGATGRHGTMRATIEWSYRLLDPDEQRLFRRLGACSPTASSSTPCSTSPAGRHRAGGGDRAPRVARAQEHGHGRPSLGHRRALPDAGDHAGVRPRAARRARRAAGGAPGDGRVGDDDRRDLRSADPCSAAVERAAIRLEREADNWREAVVVAAAERFGRAGRRAVRAAGRLLPPRASRPRRRRRARCSTSATEPTPTAGGAERVDRRRRRAASTRPGWRRGPTRWRRSTSDRPDRARRPDAVAGLGLARRLRDVGARCASTAAGRRAAAAGHPRPVRRHRRARPLQPHRRHRRHLRAGPAGAGGRRADRGGPAPGCRACSAWRGRSPTPIPGGRVALVRRALDDIADVPALTRLTLPGSASRLLSRLDPRVAAEALLDQLDAAPRAGFVRRPDPAVLRRRPARPPRARRVPEVGTVAAHRPAPSASMMDFVDEARRASAHADPVALRELERTVRRGLTALAHARPGPDPGRTDDQDPD